MNTLAPIAQDVAAEVAARLDLAVCAVEQVLGVRDGHTAVVLLRTERGPLVAKWCADGGSRAAAAMTALTRAGDMTPLAVPAVVLHDPGRGLLVQQAVPGVALSAHGGPHEASRLARAGAAVAQLHSTDIALGPLTTLADHIADLMRPSPQHLAAEMPAQAQRISLIVHRLHHLLDHAEVRATVVHRDLHLRQMYDDGARLWLLDWDLAAYGDSALDIGNLCTYLRIKLPRLAAERAIDAFLRGYRTTVPLSPALLSRVRAYEAFTYLRLACKRHRIDGPAADAQVAALLHRAETLVGGNGRRALA